MLQHFETRSEKAAFVGLLGFFVLMIGTALASVATQVGRPWPGFVVWQNLVVPAIGAPEWPGTRAGIPLRSILQEVDGRPVASAAELRQAVGAVPQGTALAYTFLHDRVTIRIAVPTTILRWHDIAVIYAGYLIVGLAFLASGLVVFYFKPSLPAARAALAVGAAIGLDLALALDLFSRGWLQRLCFVSESMMPAALLHFALCFPEPKRLVRAHPPWLALVYLPSLALAVLQNVYLGTDPARHLLVNDWVYDATAAAGLLSVASLVHTYRSSASALARQQAKVVMAGVSFAAFVPSLGLLSITALRLDLPMNLLVPFFFVYPLSIAYAIVRHDLFAVDRYLRLGVVYATLSILVFVSYAGVVVGARTWAGAGRAPLTGVVPLYVVVVLLLFEPMRSRLQGLVDRLFHRQAYSYRATVEATSRALASVLDTERVATTVLSTLTDVMTIEWAVLLIVDGDPGPRAYGRPPEKTRATLAEFPPGDPMVVAAAARARPFGTTTVGGGTRRIDAVELARFARLGAALVVPVRFQGEPLGVVLAGEKRSGAFFSDEDVDLLDTLVNQAAVALTNAHAYEIIRRTQDELVRSERLAAVGELAAAVAHGIRNPLAGIRSSAQLAREDVSGDSSLAGSLDDIVAEADRLERRVRTILDVTRPLEPRLEPHDAHRFLEGFRATIAERWPEHVRIVGEPAHGPLAAVFDRVHLAEVLETIVVNAVEAMGAAGGTITIAARADERDASGDTAVVTVADTGPGMDAARMARVFDLFYTTKPTGTGVGLAIAKRLIERQNGTLEVASPPGGGAVFSIRLPAAGAVT